MLRALSKDVDDRFASAQQMLEALREFDHDIGARSVATPAAGPFRLFVLPFRSSGPIPTPTFSRSACPMRSAASLANLDSIAVQSSLAPGRLAADADLKTIAAASDVDVVLSGTMLRAGDELRVTAQLVDVATGTLTWSHTAQSPLGDIFRLQDSLVDRIVESLSLPLTARERRLLKHDEPTSAVAYEFYLRANQIVNGAGVRLWTDRDTRALALDLYRRSIDADANYAPSVGGAPHGCTAWPDDMTWRRCAKRRSCRRCRQAGTRAESQPAGGAYASCDARSRCRTWARGAGAPSQRSRHRTSDPELFTALCQVCRYPACSTRLCERTNVHSNSIPESRTPVGCTRSSFAVNTHASSRSSCSNGAAMPTSALRRWPRLAGSTRRSQRLEPSRASSALRRVWDSLVVSLYGPARRRSAQSIRSCAEATADAPDPELIFYASRHLAFMGDATGAIDYLSRVVDTGYFCAPSLEQDPWFDAIREHPAFGELLRKAQQGRRVVTRGVSRRQAALKSWGPRTRTET